MKCEIFHTTSGCVFEKKISIGLSAVPHISLSGSNFYFWIIFQFARWTGWEYFTKTCL